MSELKEDQTAIRIPLQTKRPPRFHLNDEANQQAMLKYLEEEGYAVIASAASVEQVEKAKELFWAYHEMVGSNAKRDDPSTWDSQNWIGSKDVGIIRSPSFCHSEFLWFARTLPKVKQCFGLIWNDEDLLVSFDAGNAYRPWRYDPQWVTQGNWWHVDQNSLKGKSREGKVCVQGLMSFYDATEESGGLCVVPRSHHLHNEVCTRNSNSAKMMYDYVYLDSRDPALQSEQAVGGSW